MNRVLPVVIAVSLIGLSGCKIIHESNLVAETPSGPEGDVARNEARLDATFDSQLVPMITDNALTVAELRSVLAGGLDTAGAAHANQGSGRGSAWNFPVKGEGKVIEAKTNTSARSVLLDTDADGAGDITIQLGPVIRGTALRDAAPFYDFDEFRDQIEFAKLSRAINDRIKPSLIVPDEPLVGTTVSFLGVVPLKKADERMVVTPIDVKFGK